MELSIIIVNWNTKDLLKKCLESIYQNCSETDYEVIVADNSSQDESSQMVEKYFPQVKLVKNDYNLGFAKANNRAFGISKGKNILILNPDIIIRENAVESMLVFLREHNDAGAVGAKLLNPDGSAQKSGYYRKFPSLMQILIFYTILSKIFVKSPKIYVRYFEDNDMGNRHEVEQIPGACILVKREVYEKTNGFDEDYFIWFEDVDWCYRMKKAGWKLYYLPEAEVVHYGGQSFLNINSGEKITLFHTSLLKYFYKNRSKKDYLLVVYIIKINFIIVNILQLLIYPFVIKRRIILRDNISARWRFIKNV